MSSSSRRDLLKGLYLILDESWSAKCTLSDVLREAGHAGVQLVQYRNKHGSMSEAYRRAVKLRDLAGTLAMTFIVNDRCDLARMIEADGVHIGQLDLPLDMARELMGSDRLIGVSTHRKEEVQDATRGGADYLGFGPIYPTTTKKDHEPLVGPDGLKAVRSLTKLPIFAIGRISPESTHEAIAAGANGVAVASAILDSVNIRETIRQFIAAFHQE